jgi:hypothetical protein
MIGSEYQQAARTKHATKNRLKLWAPLCLSILAFWIGIGVLSPLELSAQTVCERGWVFTEVLGGTSGGQWERVFPASGGIGSISVKSGCPGAITPQVLPANGWITITAVKEIASAVPGAYGPTIKVDFSVAPNATGTARSGGVTVTNPLARTATVGYGITQRGGAPRYELTLDTSSQLRPSFQHARDQARVTVRCTLDGAPIGCSWSLRLTDQGLHPLYDDHSYTNHGHAAGRPLGGLTSGTACAPYVRGARKSDRKQHAYDDVDTLVGTADSSGISSARYCSPETGGLIYIEATATAAGSAAPLSATATIQVSEPRIDTRVLDSTTLFVDRDHTGGHDNRWTSAAMARMLTDAAQSFHDDTGLKFRINDLSLRLGGLFDYERDWRPPHTLHRNGSDADISIRNSNAPTVLLNRLGQKALENAILGAGFGFPFSHEAPGAPITHWHVHMPSAGSPDTSLTPDGTVTCPAGPNRLSVDVNTVVSQQPSGQMYAYELHNLPASEQVLTSWQLRVAAPVLGTAAPPGWAVKVSHRQDSSIVHWYEVASGTGLPPGARLAGFRLTASTRPSPTMALVFGDVEVPRIPEDVEETDFLAACERAMAPAAAAADGPMPGAALRAALNASTFTIGAALSVTAQLRAGDPGGPVDAYIAVQIPGGAFLSAQLGGALVPGLVPIARGITPVNLDAVIVNYTFTGFEPTGDYTWYAALTRPGTLEVVGVISQTLMTVR